MSVSVGKLGAKRSRPISTRSRQFRMALLQRTCTVEESDCALDFFFFENAQRAAEKCQDVVRGNDAHG